MGRNPEPRPPRAVWARVRRGLAESFGVDLRGLAAFRVALGALLIADLVARVPSLTAHYTDAGVLPRELVRAQPVLRRILLLDGSVPFVALVFALMAATALTLAIGYRPQLMALVALVGWHSLIGRNPYVRQGFDDLLVLVLLWSVFAFRRPDPRDRPFSGSSIVFNAGTAALVGQVVVLYVGAGLAKDSQLWESGRALGIQYRALHMVTPLGYWLSGFPGLLEVLTRVAPPFELYGAFVLLVPLRWGLVRTAAVLAFVGMHVFFMLTLRIALFPWLDVVMLLPLLPPWFWDRAERLSARVLGRSRRRADGSKAADPAVASGLRWAGPLQDWLCIALFAVSIVWIVGGRHHRTVRAVLQPLVHELALWQDWPLFAEVSGRTKWLVIEADLSDGSHRDLLHPDVPVGTMPPPREIDIDVHWRKYNQTMRTGRRLDRAYLEYWCARWNREHPDATVAGPVQFWYMKRTVRRGRPPGRLERKRLASANCELLPERLR